ncbi:MAG: hypothetical protein JJU36_16455 [Phycisphaeraceae bacterium]|nr:hypothetical protein [Phycisphaeraceae bacterium]
MRTDQTPHRPSGQGSRSQVHRDCHRSILGVCLLVAVMVWLSFGSGGGSGGGAAVAVAAPAPPGGQARQADPRVEMLQRAYRALDQGQPRQAIEHLETILRPGEGPRQADPIVHAALVLHQQLAGAFNARHAVWHRRAIQDVVVLVPDESAAIQAMAGWTDTSFYPVLIDDGYWSTLFIRRLQPSRVVMMAAPESPAEVDEAVRAAAEANDRRLNRPDAPPQPGMVMIEPGSPQRVAGLALALGRGQSVFFHELGKRFTDILTEEEVGGLTEAAFRALTERNLPAVDTWLGLTLAGNYPYRYRVSEGNAGIRATTDKLGRNPGNVRFAVAGHLVGDAAQSLYQAMSSLFLDPENVFAFDAYPAQGSPLSNYRMQGALNFLPDRLRITSAHDQGASAESFRQAVRPINPFDLVLINSSGGLTRFNVRGGGHASDMPIGRATAVHFVHSFSAQRVELTHTLAGRAIAGGAFWYFGSVNEPFLSAFVHPNQLLSIARNGTPLGFAARRNTFQPLHQPWNLTLIGDPLFSLRTEPARRTEARPAEHLSEISDWEHADDPFEVLKRRAILDAESAWKSAVTLMKQPDEAPAPVLRLAGLLLIEAGREAEVLQLPDGRIQRDWLLRRAATLALRAQFDQVMPDEMLEAWEVLARLAMVQDHDVAFKAAMDAWWSRMNENRETAAAAQLLRELREAPNLPRDSARLIDARLPGS